jgi:hypothetical protein
MAGRLLEEDPDLAHRHVLSAARRAGRIAVVRESLAISAYATGDFALALRELRTFRRISGSDEQVPLMVDSERGVGRPDRALELGRSIDRTTLSPGAQVSLAIDPDRAFSYSPALFGAYALVLEELGRTEEAAEWQRRADIAERAVFAAEGGGDDETIEVIEEEHDAPAGTPVLERESDDDPRALVDEEPDLDEEEPGEEQSREEPARDGLVPDELAFDGFSADTADEALETDADDIDPTDDSVEDRDEPADSALAEDLATATGSDTTSDADTDTEEDADVPQQHED